MLDLTDRQIIDLLKSPDGKHGAFELMVKAYSRKLYWHVRRLVGDHEDANDVIQNVYIKVWENLGRFRGDARIYTWLYRIASNEALNFIQGKSRRSTVALSENEEQYSALAHDESGPDGDAIQQKLEKAIGRLPHKQRLVFNLRYYEDMKYEDMAEVTGTSVGALKASYHHAVKKIEEYINED